jgi:hypothetical protein
VSKSDFDAFVARQQAEAHDKGYKPQQQLEQWLRHLENLYAQIAEYLKPYIGKGTAKVELYDVDIYEEFIGKYKAKAMNLKIGISFVSFTPVGTMLIGTNGRVDVCGSLGNARLVLIDKEVTSARQLIQVSFHRLGDSPPELPKVKFANEIEWAWKLSTPPPEMNFLDLTQEVFFSMIIAVADA